MFLKFHVTPPLPGRHREVPGAPCPCPGGLGPPRARPRLAGLAGVHLRLADRAYLSTFLTLNQGYIFYRGARWHPDFIPNPPILDEYLDMSIYFSPFYFDTDIFPPLKILFSSTYYVSNLVVYIYV